MRPPWPLPARPAPKALLPVAPAWPATSLLLKMWRHLEDHRRLEHPTVTAKILTHLGWSIRARPALPRGLIPTDPRFTPVQPLSRHSPLTFTPRATSNGLEIWHRGPINGPKSPQFQDSLFDNSTHPAVLFLSTEKGVYFSCTPRSAMSPTGPSRGSPAASRLRPASYTQLLNGHGTIGFRAVQCAC